MPTKLKEVAAAEPAVEGPAVPNAFSDTIKIALYGRFGSRKTLQAGHLVELVGADNVLVISAERGLGTIRSTLTNVTNIVPVTNMDELRKAFVPAREFAGADANRWVVVDGMSSVVEWLANDQFSGADRYYDAKVKNQTIAQADQVFGRFMSDKGAIDAMRIYGRVGRDSQNLLNAWVALPCNLYCNYLEDMTGSSGYEKVPPYGPDVPGKVGLKAVMSSFDFVGRLSYDGKGELVAGFDSRSNYYMARTREDRTVVEIPNEIANFRLDKFVQLIKGELTLTATEG